jgi:hypothetical protein
LVRAGDKIVGFKQLGFELGENSLERIEFAIENREAFSEKFALSSDFL